MGPTSSVEDAAQAPDKGISRREILGIPLAMTDYDGAVGVIERMIDTGSRGWVCAAPVSSVVTAQDDAALREALTGATLTVPDGMPLVWAANALGERLAGRVYGPDLMLHACARAAEREWRIWLYGGRDDAALEALEARLVERYPRLRIAGSLAPPYRDATPAEDRELAARIDADRPDVVWVGIGSPRQEKWMVRMRPLLEAPVLCAVGAAFDFHAGLVPQAPAWMQDHGLEWLYRASREPRRLVPRYLRTNPRFVAGFARQYARERRSGQRRPGT